MTTNSSSTASAGVQLSPLADPTAQWLNARLALRPELKFDVRKFPSQTQVVIEDPVRGKFFQIGFREYRLIALLKPEKSLQEVAVELAAQSEDTCQPMDDNRIVQIAQWLVQNNLVYAHGVDNSKRLEAQATALQRARMLNWVNPISCKFKLFNPNGLLTRIQPYTQWLFSGWVLLIWFAFGGYALVTLCQDWDRLGSASTGILSGNSWIWLMLIWILLKVVHETAHGIACRKYGGEVPEAGVLLLLFTPLAYVNVTSMWRIQNRWQRIVVAAAGMYVELFISFVAILVWHYFPGEVGKIAFDVFIMSSVTTLLFNANPLMRFDGYFILSDLLDIPNLYTKGTKWFGNRLKCLYFGLPKAGNLFSEHERRPVMIYGAMAYVWKFLICIGLIIGASVMFYGAGIALAAVGAVLWFGIPGYKHVRALFGKDAPHRISRRRLAMSGSLTLGAIAGLFLVLKAPAQKSAPAIVQFADEQVIRAKADGFVEQIKIGNGESVIQGQVLMVLSNPQLSLEVAELSRKANEAEIEARIHRRAGEMALSQVSEEQRQSFLQQLQEKRNQLDALTITAPFDGIVYERNIENRINSYAKIGDPLLSIARTKNKELIVTIDQRDLDSIEGNEGKFLTVLFPGQPVFQSRLTRINPRATNRLEFPSLSAGVGGPLAVKPRMGKIEDSEDPYELLIPHFQVELAVDPEMGQQLQSGQRGMAMFSTRRQSLGSYLYIAASDWLKHKIDIATQTAVF